MHSSKFRVEQSHAVQVFPKTRNFYASVGKRALDLLVVAAALPFLVPFFLIVGALVVN